jgi:hypothetical protein
MTCSDHTFIIPAYKGSDFIEECIISLKQQTLNSKIIITTSTPSSFVFDISRKYNIEIYINKNGNNIANDWNFAYKMCQTKYLTLAHQDDIYLPEYTEQCLNYAEIPANSDSLMIFTDYKEIAGDHKKKVSLIIFVKKALLSVFLLKNNIKSNFLKRSILSFGNPISCPSVMFNVKNIGPFEFSEEYQYNIDWEAWLRLAKKEGKFIYINKKLMVHRLHDESQTFIQIQNDNRYKEEEKIFQSIWNKPFARLIMKIYKYSSSLNVQKPY